MESKDFDVLIQTEELKVTQFKRQLLELSQEKDDLNHKIENMHKRFLKSKPSLNAPNYTRFRAQETLNMQRRIDEIDQEIIHIDDELREVATIMISYETLRDQIAAQEQYKYKKYLESQAEELIIQKYGRM